MSATPPKRSRLTRRMFCFGDLAGLTMIIVGVFLVALSLLVAPSMMRPTIKYLNFSWDYVMAEVGRAMYAGGPIGLMMAIIGTLIYLASRRLRLIYPTSYDLEQNIASRICDMHGDCVQAADMRISVHRRRGVYTMRVGIDAPGMQFEQVRQTMLCILVGIGLTHPEISRSTDVRYDADIVVASRALRDGTIDRWHEKVDRICQIFRRGRRGR